MLGCDWFCGGCGAISGLPGGGVDVLCPKSRKECKYDTRASRSVYSALRSMCCIGLFLGAEDGILDVCVCVVVDEMPRSEKGVESSDKDLR